MSITLFGIKNCDTVRKAKKWLEANNVVFNYHDFREDGIDNKTVTSWCETLGYETLLNKRSTTFRALSDKQKTDIDNTKAITLMLENPTLIKRPVLQHGKKLIVGFSEKSWRDFL